MTPDLFLAHANALRSLARSLLRDEDAAEDVLQDTWVTALTRPPARVVHAGAWLRAVVRSLALRRLRGDGRRGAREALVARVARGADGTEGDRDDDAGGDLEERKALLRLVVDACLELEEPYQAVVFLRYFDGLVPGEIGTKLGRSEATVKSQLHRGLALLRTRLDRSVPGGRRAWSIALVPLVERLAPSAPGSPVFDGLDGPNVATASRVAPPLPGGLPSALTLGGLAMASHVKLALALAVVASLGAALWWNGDIAVPAVAPDPRPVREEVSAVVAPAAPDSVQLAAADAATDEPARVAVSPEESPERWVPTPLEHESAFFAWVEDALGHPISGASVFLGPDRSTLNELGTTDSKGHLSFRWAMERPQADMVFAIRLSDYRWTGLRRFVARDGAVHIGRVTIPDGESPFEATADVELESTTITLARMDGTGELEFRTAENEYGSQWLDSAPRPLGPEELARDWKAGFPLCFRSLAASEVRSDVRYARLAFRLVGDRFATRSDAANEQVERASVRGRVFDDLGAPAPGAAVALFVDDILAVILEADEDGAYAIETAPAGDWRLYAGGGAYGRGSFETRTTGGEDLLRDLRLERGVEVFGTLVDPDGRPLADWTVEIEGVPGERAWSAVTVVASDGGFALANVPDSSYRLFVRPPGTWTAPPTLVVESVRPGEALALVAAAPEGALRLAVRDESGRPARAHVRVWHEDSGRGLAAPDEGDGTFALHRLPPGPYRVEVGAGTRGWLDLGTVWVGAGDALDLGLIELDPPATLTWTVDIEDRSADESQRFLLFDADAALPTLALEGPLRGDRRFELAAGRYLLVTASGPAGPIARAIELAPGILHELALEGVTPRSTEAAGTPTGNPAAAGSVLEAFVQSYDGAVEFVDGD